MPTLFKQYRREIRQSMDWESLLQELGGAKGKAANYVFVDTFFSLLPSSKVYPPRIDLDYSACLRCHGSGRSKRQVTCPQCSTRAVDSLVKSNCEHCNGSGKISKRCRFCGGSGSQEAYRDQEYWRALQNVANDLGLWIARGEDDSNCVFAGRKQTEAPI